MMILVNRFNLFSALKSLTATNQSFTSEFFKECKCPQKSLIIDD
jgi:hypothetical protein